MKFDAIIFDMDGVLVDTEQFYADYRAQFFGGKGISIAQFKPSFFIGSMMSNLWPQILGAAYTSLKAQQLQAEYVALKARTPLPYKELLFEEVRPTLAALRAANLKLALASSSGREDIGRMLTENQLTDFFDLVLSGADFKESKPNPEIYQVAMQKLSVKFDRTLIIEDSQNGIAAGKAAGATVWALKDERFGMDQSAADLALSNLTEIKNRILRS